MNAWSLLVALRARGIALKLESGRLIASPASSLTSDDADQIRAMKPDLVKALTPRLVIPRRLECQICGATLHPGSAWRCPDCRDRLTRERDERQNNPLNE